LETQVIGTDFFSSFVSKSFFSPKIISGVCVVQKNYINLLKKFKIN